MKTQTTQAVSFGNKVFVCDVVIDTDRRYVGVYLPCSVGHLASAIAWKVGESLGWKMGNGGSYGLGSSAHARCFNPETGNGRSYSIEYAK